MSFTILTIIFTIFAGIAGSLLAHHYSVYALLPATFFFLALAAAGCVVYGANFSASALAALSGVIGLQFGYLLRIFVPRSGGRSGAMSSDSKRVHHDRPPQRRLGGRGSDARRFVPNSGDS
jgi:hypothetical protein